MIESLDHLVLTTRDKVACVDFYTRVLGMRLDVFGQNRLAFHFGSQKINVHEYGHEFEPKAHLPVPGSLDLCLVSQQTAADVILHCQAQNWPIVEGPVMRTGAVGQIESVYLRDPDLNLIEIAHYGVPKTCY